MLYVLYLALLMYMSSGSHIPVERIIGGNEVDIIDYPYQVSFGWSNEHLGGGVIVSETFVITAAHCIDGVDQYLPYIFVRANSSVLMEGGETIPLKKMYQHPLYVIWTHDYDIAILELQRELKFGPGIQPVALPDTIVPDGTKVSISGWGATKEHGSLSHLLRAVEVYIVPREECKVDYENVNQVTDRMICAGVPEGGKESCAGDSGGPVVAESTLVGIVSWGYGCGEKGYPGVYTNIAALRDYIKEITHL